MKKLQKTKSQTPRKILVSNTLSQLSETEIDEVDNIQTMRQNQRKQQLIEEEQTLQKKQKLNSKPTPQQQQPQPVQKQASIWQERNTVLSRVSPKIQMLPVLFNYATAPKSNSLFGDTRKQVLNIGFCISEAEDGDSFQYKDYDGNYVDVEDEELIQDLQKLVQFSKYVAKKL